MIHTVFFIFLGTDYKSYLAAPPPPTHTHKNPVQLICRACKLSITILKTEDSEDKIIKMVTVFLRFLDGVFSFQNNPEDLDPSYKTDLYLWDYLERVKLVL